MHRNIIPTEMQSARAERPVRLDPFIQNSFDDGGQCRVQLWKTVTQQQAQIDALSAIVKLALVNGQTRGFGKRFREPVLGKKIPLIIGDAPDESTPASVMSSQRVNFGESLHDKTRVEMINKI